MARQLVTVTGFDSKLWTKSLPPGLHIVKACEFISSDRSSIHYSVLRCIPAQLMQISLSLAPFALQGPNMCYIFEKIRIQCVNVSNTEILKNGWQTSINKTTINMDNHKVSLDNHKIKPKGRTTIRFHVMI